MSDEDLIAQAIDKHGVILNDFPVNSGQHFSAADVKPLELIIAFKA